MIRNYRIFESFEMDFTPGMNIIVGDNDAGKSTVLEAVHLALTAKINGKPLAYELSPFLFNADVTAAYFGDLANGKTPSPPEIIIDLFLSKSDETAPLAGSNNLLGVDSPGVRIRVALSPQYASEYLTFVTADPSTNKLIPAEYFVVEWLAFSGNGLTFRSIPATSSFIDASSIKLQNGVDYHLQAIIREQLDPKDRVELSRSYRSARETFSDHPAVKAVNGKLSGTKGDVSDKELSLAIDISQRYTWESSLVTHLDGLPFQFVGDGEQNTLKILLALNRKAGDSHVILIEEPENHLSFASLNMLIWKIADKCKDKQVLLTTHSSYVLNKLGIGNLILQSAVGGTRISDLSDDTQDYFMKLSGYDTLRLVLARGVILVEGPSDELIVQRAYMDTHGGKLPIEDGIDVINVRGLSAKRFLDVAMPLQKKAAVVTDNDGDPAAAAARYAEYAAESFITIHVGADPSLTTLEPQLLAANGLSAMNSILGKSYTTEAELLNYMKNEKTTVALKIFESDSSITMPEYIQNAVV